MASKTGSIFSAVAMASAIAVASPAYAASAGSKPTEVRALSTASHQAATTRLLPDGVWHCDGLDNGQLCIRFINNYTGVDERYDKRSGDPISIRFLYYDNSAASGVPHSDNGAVTIAANQSRSFAWNNTYPRQCVQGVMSVNGVDLIVTERICRS
ncbi:hypothetical protein [Krasilnikovia sp. MM14-A1259]|uniref:hypothetical protein n=1 Tax=Krasilnikovia sp. MM14-A1259 TaxID=3373539 RepID=UPI0037FD11B4